MKKPCRVVKGWLLIWCISTVIFSSTAQEPPELQGITARHNYFRHIFQAPPIEWDDSVASAAQTFTDSAAVLAACPGQGGTFQHNTDGGKYGQNFAGSSFTYPNQTIGETAVDLWMLEEKQYNFQDPGFSDSTGHFTQVVWIASTKLGCGYRKCPTYNGLTLQFVICNYLPPGNVIGEFSQNVKPPITNHIDFTSLPSATVSPTTTSTVSPSTTPSATPYIPTASPTAVPSTTAVPSITTVPVSTIVPFTSGPTLSRCNCTCEIS
ncbi:hypothetical protein GpartN1_g4452.t1 [Galdieria partita]|uniref:SCP domain-containing protein n=1 Tax=Galdieria partita TaxID=83374 RepID=A0A9C7PZC1_9RHOD|nr:hypothetical protein GpartN1_g4452.t1 [Galdieria partita]